MKKYITLLNGYILNAREAADKVLLEASMDALLKGVLPNDLRIKTSLVLGESTLLPESTDFVAMQEKVSLILHEMAISSIIENKCQELGYDDQNSIAKYLVHGNPFYEECTAISLWIGAVWVTIRNIQDAVASGTRDMPTIDEVIAELPKCNA